MQAVTVIDSSRISRLVLNRRCVVGLGPVGFSVHGIGMCGCLLSAGLENPGASRMSPSNCWKSAFTLRLAIRILFVWMWHWATKVGSQQSPNPVSHVNLMTFMHIAESESVDGMWQ